MSERRQRALSGGLWVATSRALPLVGTALLSISIGRILGPDLLGLQNYIAFVDALLATAVQWVLITVSIRLLAAANGAGDTVEIGHLRRVTWLLNTAAGLASAVVLLAIAAGSSNPHPWIFAAVGAALNGMGWGYAVGVIGSDGWAGVAKRRLLTQILAVALGLVAVFTGMGIAGVFAAMALGSAAFLGSMRLLHGPVRWGAIRPLPTGLLRTWLQLCALEVLVQLVVQKSEVVFLQWWTDHGQIAMFSVAFMVVASSATLPIALVVSGMPMVASSLGAGTIDATLSRLSHPIRIALFASLPLAAFVASVGPSAVLALYGPAFATAAELVPAMSLVLVLGTAGMVCVTFWIGADRPRIALVAAGVGALVDIAVAVALIPGLQVWGAVWANVAGQSVMAVMVLWLTHRRGGRLHLDLIRWLLVAVAAAGVTLAILETRVLVGSESAAQRWGGLVLVALLAVALFTGVGATAGYLDPRDLPWLHQTLPPKLQVLGRMVGGRRWAEVTAAETPTTNAVQGMDSRGPR